MLGIPAVRSRVVVGKGGGLALEGRVGGAEDGLAHVAEAVDHVPVVVVGDLVARLEAGVGLHNGPEAVQLVRHGRGEDGHALVPLDGVRQVVILGGFLDPLEAHAD